GTNYQNISPVMGSYTLSGIPYGEYTVMVTDNFGGVLYQQVSFVELQLNIHEQLEVISTNCGFGFNPNMCNNVHFIDTNGGCLLVTLDASVLINANQNVTYEWFMY